MNEERSVEDSSYLSYEINGTRYILQTVSDPAIDITKTASTNQEQSTINIIDESQIAKEDESISLICLDGQIYAFQNGELQELDFNQIIDENESQNKTVLLAKEDDNCESQFITNEGLVIENIDEHSQEQYEIIVGQNEKNLIMEKHNVNANDFVEVVTAFKCKICTYTTQDKTQLLHHFQKTHVNPKMDIEVTFKINFLFINIYMDITIILYIINFTDKRGVKKYR